MPRAGITDFMRGLFEAIDGQAASLRATAEPSDWDMLDLGLMSKLFQTLSTIQTLKEPSTYHQGGKSVRFVDFASIGVLTRSAAENCLISEWLFGEGEPERQEFHRLVWQYGGLSAWANSLPTNGKAKSLAQDADKSALELRPTIEAGLDKFYPDITARNRKNVIAGQWMKLLWLPEVASSVGHHRRYFRAVYDQLSGYTHSDFRSAKQCLTANSLNVQLEMADAISIQLMPLLAHALSSFLNRCPAAMAAAGSAIFLSQIKSWSQLAGHQERLLNEAWSRPAT